MADEPVYATGQSYTADSSVWTNWSASTDDSCTSTNYAVWDTWNTRTASGNYMMFSGFTPMPPQPLSQEEAARIEAMHEQAMQEEMRRQQEHDEANRRAEELLRIYLTDEQQEMLDRQSSFLVESETGKTFRIRRDMTVKELDENGEGVATYCIHPVEDLPAHDTMLMQMLLLQAGEAEFMRIANRSAIYRREPGMVVEQI